MIKTLFVSLLSCVSCLSDTQDITNDSSNDQTVEDPADESYAIHNPGPNEGCGQTQSETIYVENGRSFTVQIATPCEPFWFDKGDPPPDDLSDDYESADNVQRFIRVEQ